MSASLSQYKVCCSDEEIRQALAAGQLGDLEKLADLRENLILERNQSLSFILERNEVDGQIPVLKGTS